MHWKDARAAGEAEQRLYSLPAWREIPYYSERERAGLLLAEELTWIADRSVPDDLQLEQEKSFRADPQIFQFPLCWFGLPAILKGWLDRVFAAGLTYGGGRWYSNGVFKGKRAMLSLTTGSHPTIYSPRCLNGDIDAILFPIQHGMLYFVGFDVLPPFVAYSVARRTQEQREKALRECVPGNHLRRPARSTSIDCNADRQSCGASKRSDFGNCQAEA
jgi:putative NADPH-quinone reductase